MTEFKDILFEKEVNNIEVIPMKVFDLLNMKKYTLAIAESITGGEVCASITKVPGASKVFIGGIIAYNNFVKVSECQVSPKTIQRYSAVSSQVTAEMAKGIQNKFQTDVALALTGFAGPQIEQEKVGLVYLTLRIKTIEYNKNFLFNGDRDEIIKQASFAAFELTRYYLANL